MLSDGANRDERPPVLPSSVTLRQAVVQRLRHEIVSGHLEPGTLLREVALGSRLGVSATPVREALGELVAEGLVEVETHRLKRVAPIDLPAMSDLLQVQSELWRLGYDWGMPKIGQADLSRLELAVRSYGDSIRQGDPLAAIQAGHAFHTVVISASANRELLRSTLDRRSLIARFILLYGRNTLSPRGLDEHVALLNAIRRRDFDEALERLDRLSSRLRALATTG